MGILCTATDFDEQCSKEDDWDVDTSLYYNPGKKGKIVNFSII